MADSEEGRSAIEAAPRLSLVPTQEPISLPASPFVWRDPATIPRRQFLYGFELRRKQLSAMVAPGAGGKTTLKVGRALAMVTGRDLFGHRVWNGPHRVWLWNLEDELEEVEKTIHAFLKLWNISEADLGGRLFVDGVDSPGSKLLKLAREDKVGGFVIQRPVVDAVIEEMKAQAIDYLDVDPFVSSHCVNENDNGAIDAVSKEWVAVAMATNSAIGLAHHVRKPSKEGGGDAGAFDARGAVAMINAARSCLVLNRMSALAADELGIQPCDRKRYFSVYDDKNNKAPPALKAEWYEFVGVDLGNADVGSDGPGDNVGACKRWEPPDAFGGVTAHQLRNIQLMIENKPDRARKHSQSKDWVGKMVATVLDLNLDDPPDEAKVKLFLRTWLSTGALRSEERKDGNGDLREYVVVGNWAIVE